MISDCPLCDSKEFKTIFEIKDVPIFENKVYDTEAEAKAAITGNVTLVKCNNCNFVFNKDFENELMDYDDSYQNEQSNSKYFQAHLSEVADILKKEDIKGKKIIELGCGKGYFLKKMREEGLNVIGFDPAYEGNDPSIVKEYFSEKHSGINADFIILRHTLEHISHPFEFLKMVAKSNKYQGKIFIEVPGFEWIAKKSAFWDIFHEHCNYFTKNTLSYLFENSKSGYMFNGQYFFVIAELKDLKQKIQGKRTEINELSTPFSEKINIYLQFLKNNKGLAIWGAGAKGVSFLNVLDPKKEYVDCVIDINPKKQKKYIAKTGHRIISPVALEKENINTILVMNENYLEEIKLSLKSKDIKIIAAG